MFVGYGVSAPERNWDDFKGEDVQGKLLVVLVNDPDFEGGEGDFGGKAMTYYGRWTYKYEEAARRGAAGVLIVHETDARLLRLEHGQELQHQHDVRHRPPEPGGRAHAVRKLDPARRSPSRCSPRRASTSTRRRPRRGADFRPIAAQGDAHRQRPGARPKTITSHNVVGMLPGKKYPDETVIYTAHWDHLGIGKPDANGDQSTMARSTTRPASRS